MFSTFPDPEEEDNIDPRLYLEPMWFYSLSTKC
jgi:hypothetical protein